MNDVRIGSSLMDAQLLFLGTGSSLGIPVIGCKCSVCKSQDSRNKRMRPSALIKKGEQKILIDCGPDFRQQALQYGIDSLDGAILTHAHNDHTAGIDELRVYYMHTHKSLPLLLSQETEEDIRTRFAYIFHQDRFYKLLPTFELHVFKGDVGEIDFLGFKIGYYSYTQAKMKVHGLRFGNLAYVTDIRDYDEGIFEFLNGVDTLVLSALRDTPSHLHLSIEEACRFAEKSLVKHTWLTHLAHDLDHELITASLPTNVQLAYDGLKIQFYSV